MPDMINPFDATPGFTLASMTRAINILPNQWGLINDLGIFREEGISQLTVLVEQNEGNLSLLPPAPRGGRPTVGNRTDRSMRAFVVPHIPHDDVITPQDLQGVRAFGSTDSQDGLTNLMNTRLGRMRTKHMQTKEYMQLRALQGVLKAGDGTTLYDYQAEFGLTANTLDFVLGTAGTDVPSKIRALARYTARNLKGETMTGIMVLCSPSFWDKFIKHSSVTEAYKYFQNNAGAQPMREDTRKGFRFHGVTFMEYDATFTLSDGTTTEEALTTDYAIALPMGTQDVFVQYNAPGNFMDAVGTQGQFLYARQLPRQDGTGIDLKTESNPLPMCRRPGVLTTVYSSN